MNYKYKKPESKFIDHHSHLIRVSDIQYIEMDEYPHTIKINTVSGTQISLFFDCSLDMYVKYQEIKEQLG